MREEDNNSNCQYNYATESIASKARGWIGFCYLFGRGRIIKNEPYAVEIF